MKKLKGRIRNETLKRILLSRDYKSHTAEKGVYTVTTIKSQFEIVPISAKYMSVYQLTGSDKKT